MSANDWSWKKYYIQLSFCWEKCRENLRTKAKNIKRAEKKQRTKQVEKYSKKKKKNSNTCSLFMFKNRRNKNVIDCKPHSCGKRPTRRYTIHNNKWQILFSSIVYSICHWSRILDTHTHTHITTTIRSKSSSTNSIFKLTTEKLVCMWRTKKKTNRMNSVTLKFD